jgi:hypothetical protein
MCVCVCVFSTGTIRAGEGRVLASPVVENGTISRDIKYNLYTEECQVTFASLCTQYCVFWECNESRVTGVKTQKSQG